MGICPEEMDRDLGSVDGISMSLLGHQKLEISWHSPWFHSTKLQEQGSLCLDGFLVTSLAKGFKTGRGLLIAVGSDSIANTPVLNSET